MRVMLDGINGLVIGYFSIPIAQLITISIDNNYYSLVQLMMTALLLQPTSIALLHNHNS